MRRSAERVLRARRGCGGYGWRGESAEGRSALPALLAVAPLILNEPVVLPLSVLSTARCVASSSRRPLACRGGHSGARGRAAACGRAWRAADGRAGAEASRGQWGEGWGRCGVAVPLRARLCVTSISVPSSIPSNLSPSRPLRVTTTWRWERRDAKLSGAYAWATWAASGRLRRLRATASRWAPHGMGAPPEACSAAPSQGLRSRGRRASCVTFDTLREACAKSLPSLMRPCADLPPPAAAECLLASPPTVRRAGDASGVWR